MSSRDVCWLLSQKRHQEPTAASLTTSEACGKRGKGGTSGELRAHMSKGLGAGTEAAMGLPSGLVCGLVLGVVRGVTLGGASAPAPSSTRSGLCGGAVTAPAPHPASWP
jgi:hypothetical protein